MMDVKEKLVEIMEDLGCDEAIDSIRDYMVQELLGGFDCRKAVSCVYEWTFNDGRVVELGIAIKQPAVNNRPQTV